MPEAAAIAPSTTRSAWLNRAYESFIAAEYERCLTELALLPADEANDVEPLLLRARALLYSDDTASTDTTLARVIERASSASGKAIAYTLRGAMFHARKSTGEATAAFERANALLPEASDDARSEYAYYRALAAWEDGDLHSAESIVEHALPAARDVVLVMLIQLLGWIEISRERHAAAAERFLEALSTLSRGDRQDLRFRGHLVDGLASIASETIDLKLATRYEAFLAGTAWTSAIARQHFNTIMCQRSLALLRGRIDDAWRFSRDAIGIAPSPAFRAVAETNAAAMSALVGDAYASQMQFKLAWSLIEAISWESADAEERVALTTFAIEAASVMPAEAHSAVTLYRNVTSKLDQPTALHGGARRLQAFEAMAAGRVSDALGKANEAIESYERSRQLWIALDYRMRAALVARDLHRLTGDVRYDHDIELALARAPHAWFRTTSPATATSAHSAIARLTPAERVVLRHLLGGDGIREVAERMDRSPYTVHNHTRRIFAAFDVRKRATLLARCAEQGITADSLRLEETRAISAGRLTVG